MSLYELRDKSFSERQFADVLEYLDSYVLAQELAGLDMKYDIINGGQNHMGNIHRIVVFSRVLQKGFSLDLYENQMLSVKGVFRVQAQQSEISMGEIQAKLREKGLKFQLKKFNTGVSFAVKLSHRLQVLDLIELFSGQLP